jgi:hypothetical protein
MNTLLAPERTLENLQAQPNPDEQNKSLVFKAKYPGGFQCMLFAQEYPLEGFNACVRVPDEDAVVIRFNAVAGILSGLLLRDLCETLSQGEARLEDPYRLKSLSCWSKSGILLAIPYALGHQFQRTGPRPLRQNAIERDHAAAPRVHVHIEIHI